MTYEIGDPNHIPVHNDLGTELADMASSFGVTVVLPPVRAVGNTHHVEDHNTFRTAIQAIADGATLPKVLAAGGTETTFAGDGVTGAVGKTYKRHVFLTDGTLTVTRAGLAKAFLVGGGGASPGFGDTPGAGGGGGLLNDKDVYIPVGALAVQIGKGGVANVAACNGGPTSVGPVSVPGGGAGGKDRGQVGTDGGSGGGAADGAGTLGGRGVPGLGNAGGTAPALGNAAGDAGGGGGAGGPGVANVGGAGLTVRGVTYARGGTVRMSTAGVAPVANSGNGGDSNQAGTATNGSTGRAEIWYEI